jgi:hypothetical protein
VTKFELLKRKKRKHYLEGRKLDSRLESERKKRLRPKAEKVVDTIVGLLNGTAKRYKIDYLISPPTRLGVELVFDDGDSIKGTYYVFHLSKKSPMYNRPECKLSYTCGGYSFTPRVPMIAIFQWREGEKAEVEVHHTANLLFRRVIIERFEARLKELKCKFKKIEVGFISYMGIILETEGKGYRIVKGIL